MSNTFEPSPCLWCKEMIERGDLRHALITDMHLACAIRSVTGSIAHHEKRCSCFIPGATCTDPVDLSPREAAELVMQFLRDNPDAPQGPKRPPWRN